MQITPIGMTTTIAQRIGKNAADARKTQRRTQAEVAEKLGIDTVSLSRIERGVVAPGLATLEALADELSIPLSQLFDGASTRSATVVDSIAGKIDSLNEADRIFLLNQLNAWVEKLGEKRPKS